MTDLKLNEERAREAAEKVLIDLSDRSGMNLLDQIRWDEPELWGEIVGDGSSIILAALDAATAPLVAERERLKQVLKQVRSASYMSDTASWPRAMQAVSEALAEDDRAALAEKEPG